MAWVANRSTTVRNAVSAITNERRRTPAERPWVSMRWSITCDIWDMAQLRLRADETGPYRMECDAPTHSAGRDVTPPARAVPALTCACPSCRAGYRTTAA